MEKEITEIEEKYYTYGYEDYDGNKGVITVKAQTKKDAENMLDDYKVSRGEVHYTWLKSIDKEGVEKYYEDKKGKNAMVLAIALFGAALGGSQIANYGINKNYLDCLKDEETVELIKK